MSYLGIEIGGTKLQLGIGPGQGGRLNAIRRLDVDPVRGAEAIREQLVTAGRDLLLTEKVQRIGIGFGGPVNARSGHVIRSFQIDGWEDFPLTDWATDMFQVPALLENDSNLAGLGEALFGGGRDARVVFYSNVGSGIGGSLIVDQGLFTGGSQLAVAEIGHLRPGPVAVEPDQTVESMASGWGLVRQVRQQIDSSNGSSPGAARLLSLVDGNLSRLTGRTVVEEAMAGNRLAGGVWQRAVETYGWALAQAITLFSPNVVVVGGGVSQVEPDWFLDPLRDTVARYVMPALLDTYQITPALLGEQVVVHGALALAAAPDQDAPDQDAPAPRQ